MKRRFFFNDDDGAVTVDWVVLTAALVAIGIATTAAITTRTSDVVGDTTDMMESGLISTAF